MKMRTRSRICTFLAIISVWAVASCGRDDRGEAARSGKLPDIVDYNFHIKPILSDACFTCHGPDDGTREASLRLDVKESAYGELKENPGFHAIIPGKPSKSMVYKRVSTKDENERMPPVGSDLTLSPYEIKLIERWIEQGAKYERHWAYIPPRKSKLPEVTDQQWPRNEIDHFVLAKMEEAGLHPSLSAGKEQLLRRVAIDITGLPPDIAMMDAFLADSSPHAYQKMVDRLLASSAYGERMALHWMDVARYADSYGYQADDIRTQWPWRDWVIHAFNENMPYDQFVTWQLAGDLLPNATKEQILATAFNRNHKITEEDGVIKEEYRVTYAIDKTNTYAKGILGITMECAQCHDHKYDPFSQKNYFQLFAFFNNTPEKGLEGIVNSGPSKTPRLTITHADINGILDFVNKGSDTSTVSVSVMAERDSIRPTYILSRGRYDAPAGRVFPGTPEAIMPFDSIRYPRNRLGLAAWTFSKENPLTARVFVNQMWTMIFGRGLVSTPANFGNQGELPSHPQLLDWLAVDFMEHGWDIKRLLKQLVMSSTYRQSSSVTEEHVRKDPENVYLTRSARLRLSAELIRDCILATSGLLNREIGGPSVKPYQPAGIWEVNSTGAGALAKYVQDHGPSLYRRGLYLFFKLTVPPPNMLIFDASNRDQCEVSRERTSTPLQALVMMNDPVVLEASRVLAGTLLRTHDNQTPMQQAELAFQRILCRIPSEKERTLLRDYYDSEFTRFSADIVAASDFIKVGEAPHEQLDPVRHATLMSVVHMLYNLDETLNRT